MKHAFVSPKAAASDTTIVDGPKWNAEHVAESGDYDVSMVTGAASISYVDIETARAEAAEAARMNPTSGVIPYNLSGAFADSPLSVDASGNVQFGGPTTPAAGQGGIYIAGSATKSAILEIHNPFASGPAIYTHADAVFRSPQILMYKSQGSQASPTAVTFTAYEANPISQINFGAYDGSAYVIGGQFIWYASENWSSGSPGHHGTYCEIVTTNKGGNPQAKLQIGGPDPTGAGDGNIIAFAQISFGTNLSTYPALTYSTSPALLRVRKADASGDAGLSALTVSASTGFQIAGAATSGNYLRGNGTNFVSSTIQAADVPSLAASIITTGQIGLARGGTNADLSATGGTSQVLKQSSTGAAITVAQLAFSDISGTASASQYVTMVGDSGSGGTKGAVPAPGSGDAAAAKFLKADGTWAIPSGSGAGSVTSVAMTGDGVIFASSVGGSPITVSGTLVPALLTQTANMVLAGPTTGSAAAPTFRALVAADMPAGATLWSALGNASGALTLANAGNATTFNQTSAVEWKWANTTAASSGTSQSSPLNSLSGQYWTGAASAEDKWTLQTVIANGANGASKLTLLHSGSTSASSGLYIGNSSGSRPGALVLLATDGASTACTLAGSGTNSGIVTCTDFTFSLGSSRFLNINGPANVVSSSANGASWTWGQISELLTLSTGGTTTDTTGNLLPVNSIIEAVVARVTTTITSATSWELGDATTAGRFSAPNSTMTSGTTQIGLVHVDQTGAAGPRQTAAAKVRVTTAGTPGAGAIRITVFYRQFVAPTS